MYETVRSGVPTAEMGNGIAWNHGCFCFWERVDGTASHRDQLIRSRDSRAQGHAAKQATLRVTHKQAKGALQRYKTGHATSHTQAGKKCSATLGQPREVLVTSGTSETLVRITMVFVSTCSTRAANGGSGVRSRVINSVWLDLEHGPRDTVLLVPPHAATTTARSHTQRLNTQGDARRVSQSGLM